MHTLYRKHYLIINQTDRHIVTWLESVFFLSKRDERETVVRAIEAIVVKKEFYSLLVYFFRLYVLHVHLKWIASTVLDCRSAYGYMRVRDACECVWKRNGRSNECDIAF